MTTTTHSAPVHHPAGTVLASSTGSAIVRSASSSVFELSGCAIAMRAATSVSAPSPPCSLRHPSPATAQIRAVV